MGLDTGGWVEVNRENIDKSREWVPVIYLDYIAVRCYDLFSKLFGMRYYDANAIAFNRGAPKDLSEHVAEDMFEEGNLEGEPLSDDITWVGWWEIKDKIDWLVTDDEGKTRRDWRAVFNAMEAFARYYGDDRVRMVVGFS